MTASEVTSFVQEIEFENRKLKEENEKLKGSLFDAGKFYASTFGADDIAKLHNVSPATVRTYLKLGLIEKHPDSTDGKARVRASVVLCLDFSELRKQYQNRHYGNK